MQFVAVQEITITKVKHKGSNMISWNYDLEGKPFGSVWTFTGKGEVHPFAVSTVEGNTKFLGHFPTWADADVVLRGAM
jgi:hypothetical protein